MSSSTSTFVIRWELDEVSKLEADKDRTSPITFHSGLPWTLTARKHTPPGGVDNLQLFLYCNDDSVYEYWSCEHKTTLVVVNRKDETKNVKHEISAKFNKAADNQGKKELMLLSDLTDDKKGFIADDKIILEARVDVTAVKGIKKVTDIDFTAPKEGVDTVSLGVEGQKVYVSSGFLATESPFFADLFTKERGVVEIEKEEEKKEETKEAVEETKEDAQESKEPEETVAVDKNDEAEVKEGAEEDKENAQENKENENENKENQDEDKENVQADKKKVLTESDQENKEKPSEEVKEEKEVTEEVKEVKEAEVVKETETEVKEDEKEQEEEIKEPESPADYTLKDVTVKDFTELLLATHLSNKAVTVDSYKSLLALADRFQIQRAMDVAEQYLICTKKVTISAKLALSEQYRLELLQLHCLNALATPEATKALQDTEEFAGYSNDLKVALLARVFQLIKP